MKKMFIDYNPYCVRVALTSDGELIEFGVEHSTMRGLVGNIYKGKVENVLSGMKAAFVNIGLERNGFLYVGESLVDSGRLKDSREPTKLNVSPGDVIMCQVVKEQFGLKGARLTTDVTLPGYFLVLLPSSNFFGVSRKIEDDERRTYLEDYVKTLCPQNMGFIIRSAADKASNDDIEREAKKLVRLWNKIKSDYEKSQLKSLVFRDVELLEREIRDTFSEDVDCVVVNDADLAVGLENKVGNAKIEVYDGVRNIFAEYGISEQVNKLSDRRVDLGNGAYIIIDRTEALTVIDVNTGKFVGGKDLEDTVFKTNAVAADEIARQLRLRNISGIIVIDFIDMTIYEHKEAIVERLKTALKSDRLKTSAVEMTALGLVELTRKKSRLPVDEFMLSPCKECMGGHVVSNEQSVFVMRDELIEYTLKNDFSTYIANVSPEISDTIFEKNLMRREAAKIWFGKRVYFVPNADLKNSEHTFDGTNDKIVSLPSQARLLV